MGWLMADIATTLVVALVYWTVAVLRDAARSLALAGRRVRSRGVLQVRGMLHPPAARAPERFAAAQTHCAQPPAPHG
jgi:hypothetical protein